MRKHTGKSNRKTKNKQKKTTVPKATNQIQRWFYFRLLSDKIFISRRIFSFSVDNWDMMWPGWGILNCQSNHLLVATTFKKFLANLLLKCQINIYHVSNAAPSIQYFAKYITQFLCFLINLFNTIPKSFCRMNKMSKGVARTHANVKQSSPPS